jgi:uncharacterized protein (TIGR00269 family)
MPVNCSKCEQEAVYFRRYTAETLCKACLVQTTVNRVRRAINRNKMLKREDRIGIAISGGKDSAVLLDVLYKIEKHFPEVELVPFTIDEGIKGYRDEALKAARKLTSSLGLSLKVRSFKEFFDYSLDEIVRLRGDGSIGACSYCGVFRRQAINRTAKDLDVDVVATGHNMDDEAQTVLMNIMRGDSIKIARTHRSRHNPLRGLIPRIKPIIELSERDIVAYAYHSKLPYHDIPCPYHAEAYRNDVRAFLNEMEYKRPGTLLAILRSAETIVQGLEHIIPPAEIGRCEKCGSPSSSNPCKACSLLEEIGR